MSEVARIVTVVLISMSVVGCTTTPYDRSPHQPYLLAAAFANMWMPKA